MHPAILLLLGSITTDVLWLLIFTRFLDDTQRRTTVGRTPLNEWSVRRREHDNTQQSQQTNIHAPRRAEDFNLPLKIRRLRPGLNPRTWVRKVSTLPLDHRSRCALSWNQKLNTFYVQQSPPEENHAVCEIMCKNMVETDSTQMTV